MLSVISGKTPHEEASKDTRTFDLLRWIRARRLQWLGHIMRMGKDRKLKQAVYEMFRAPKPGDLLMDAPKVKSWYELGAYAWDKEYWKARVRSMRQRPVVRIDIGKHVEASSWAPFTVSSQGARHAKLQGRRRRIHRFRQWCYTHSHHTMTTEV